MSEHAEQEPNLGVRMQIPAEVTLENLIIVLKEKILRPDLFLSVTDVVTRPCKGL